MATPPGGIFWIASYPKSGNTWLRFLLGNLVFGAVDSAAQLNELIPDLHELRELPALGPGVGFMKTHFPYSPRLPLVSRTVGALYVVRDPADVMLSNFHYARRSGAGAPQDPTEFDRYVDAFLAAAGDPRWVRLGMGSWADNVLAWHQARASVPVLWVRYEELLADAESFARRLCRHLGLERTSGQVATAVANASFTRMREIEEADIAAQRRGIFYKPYLQSSIAAGLRFMRSGRSGAAASTLSTQQQARFDAVFGSLRRQFGYG